MLLIKAISFIIKRMGSVDIRKIFGENVKYFRKQKGLSQEKFAELLNVSTNHISVIETGSKFVTYKLLERIIDILEVTPASLFYTLGAENFDSMAKDKISSIIESELSKSISTIKQSIANIN